MFRTALAAAAALVVIPGFAVAQPITDDVDVSVTSLTPTSGAGTCLLKGWVVTVRASHRFKPGSTIDMKVPCNEAAGAQGYYFGETGTAGRSMVGSLKLSGDKVVAWRPTG
jgi:hypothetical protein